MMDHEWAKSLRVEDRSRRGTKNPSFSSTLLDAIYRSIDEGVGAEEELVFYTQTMKKKQSMSSGTAAATTATSGFRGRNSIRGDEDEMASLRRACLIEKWMEKKVSEKVVVRRNSDPSPPAPMAFHSTSSSSDSSSGSGGFSSSEAESVYGSRSRSSSSTFTSQQRPKPVRTSVSSSSRSDLHHHRNSSTNEATQFQQRSSSRSSSSSNVYDIRHSDRLHSINPQQKQSKELGGFNKTKSRALKIYGDLKKVKQPISPGGRLASFLNSIFTAGNPKKVKISSSSGRDHVEDLISSSSERKSKSAQASTCSSASSFSRSCLSKTPSSRGKPINGIKRSVRFYPVSVIVDEDSRPCGHKNLNEQEQQHLQQHQQPRLMALDDEQKLHWMEKSRRIEQVARDQLSDYRDEVKKNRYKCDIEMRDRDLQRSYRHLDDEEIGDEQDEDDDDDAASYSSSDLFELDNLASIGIERYREELPVYETTHLETNRAIANGFIL